MYTRRGLNVDNIQFKTNISEQYFLYVCSFLNSQYSVAQAGH